jgi:hypothetical protein
LEVEQTRPGGIPQHAERPREMQLAPFRCAPSVHIVDDRFIGSQLQCQKNGIAFPRVEGRR